MCKYLFLFQVSMCALCRELVPSRVIGFIQEIHRKVSWSFLKFLCHTTRSIIRVLPGRSGILFSFRASRCTMSYNRNEKRSARDSPVPKVARQSAKANSPPLPSDIPAMFVNYREVTWRE